MTFKNLKEVQRALKDLEAKQGQGKFDDGIVLIWLVAIVKDLVDYLEQKERKEGGKKG